MLERVVSSGLPFCWRKQGRIFEPDEGEYTHGSHPCAVHLDGDLFVIAYTQRDRMSRSHIMLAYATVKGDSIALCGEPRCALSPGDFGRFDCDGTISVCFVKNNESIYLYYVGWQNLPEGLWICDTGRAVLNADKLTLSREFPGPVLGRDKHNPLFAAATAFHVSGTMWQTWYNSGLRWEKAAAGWKHFYGIHYAHSVDGVNWTCEPGMCIPFADEYEYAFGRPSVVRCNETYLMWFAHRATRDTETYRIGFARSQDGRVWVRNDLLAGIDVSASGWDSEMICYPCVFGHSGTWFMLYNGNGYGKTGFGYAALECVS